MTKFVNLARKYINYDYDRGYPSPEKQLFGRLDDLHEKLEELKALDAPYRGRSRLTDDDIRYALPKYFYRTEEVERAIQLAFEDLKYKYDIDILGKTDNNEAELIEELPEQIYLFTVVPSPLKAVWAA